MGRRYVPCDDSGYDGYYQFWVGIPDTGNASGVVRYNRSKKGTSYGVSYIYNFDQSSHRGGLSPFNTSAHIQIDPNVPYCGYIQMSDQSTGNPIGNIVADLLDYRPT